MLHPYAPFLPPITKWHGSHLQGNRLLQLLLCLLLCLLLPHFPSMPLALRLRYLRPATSPWKLRLKPWLSYSTSWLAAS